MLLTPKPKLDFWLDDHTWTAENSTMSRIEIKPNMTQDLLPRHFVTVPINWVGKGYGWRRLIILLIWVGNGYGWLKTNNPSSEAHYVALEVQKGNFWAREQPKCYLKAVSEDFWFCNSLFLHENYVTTQVDNFFLQFEKILRIENRMFYRPIKAKGSNCHTMFCWGGRVVLRSCWSVASLVCSQPNSRNFQFLSNPCDCVPEDGKSD